MEVGATQAAGSGVLIQMLQKSNAAQAQLAESLITVNLENQASAEKMAIAQQIIDVYA